MTPTGNDLAAQMADLARNTAAPISVEKVLTGVTTAVHDMIPGADTCGVLLIGKGGKFESLFGTNELVHKLDALQEKYQEGPCVSAAIDDLIVRTDDFVSEQRWPQYSRACVELGVHSGLSFKLYTGFQTAGALNIFGFRPHAFDGRSEGIGSVLAAHAAVAIVSSRQGEQLESALSNRDIIGQAKGIIMERFDVDALRAFEMLKELSQTTNTRLVEIAQKVVETRGK